MSSPTNLTTIYFLPSHFLLFITCQDQPILQPSLSYLHTSYCLSHVKTNQSYNHLFLTFTLPTVYHMSRPTNLTTISFLPSHFLLFITCQDQPILQPSLSYLHTSYCLSHVKTNQSYNHLFLTFTLPTVYHMSRPTNLTTISFLPSHFLLFITCLDQPILQPSLSYLHTSYCLSHVKTNQSYNHLFLTFTLPTVYHMSRPTNLTTISFLPSHFLLFITCQDQPILQPSLSHLHTSYCLSHVKSNQSYNHLFLTFTLPTVYHMSSPTNLTTIYFLPSHFLLFITCQVQPILQPSLSYLHTSYCLSHVKTNQSYNHLFLTFTLPTVYHRSTPTNLTTISFLPSHFLLFITCQVQPILQPSLSYLHTSYCLSHVKTNQSYNHLFLTFTLPTVYHRSTPTNLTTISFLPSHFLLFITGQHQPILQPSLSYLHTSYCLSHVKTNQSYNHLFLTFTLPTVYHMSRPTNLTTISFLPSHFLLFITGQHQPILQPSLSYLHTSYCLSHVKTNQSYNHLFLTFTLPTVYHMSRPTNLTTISFLPSHFLLFITCQDQPILQPSLSYLHTSYCLSHVKTNQSYNHLFLTFTLPTVYHMSRPTNLTTIYFLPSHFLLFITCQDQPILQPSLSYLHTSYCLTHVKSNQSYNHLFLTFTLPTVYHMSSPTNLTTIYFLPSHFLLFITCQVQPILQPSISYLHTSYCLSHVKSNQSYNHLFLTFTLPTVYHMSSPTNLTTISFLPSHFLLFITCQDQPILQPSLSELYTSYCLSHVKTNQSYNHLFLTFTLPTVYHMSSPTNLTTISFLPSHFLLFITCQDQPILQPSLSELYTSYCLSHVKSNQSYNHLFLTFTLPTVYHMSRPTNLTTISFLPSHFLLFITCQDQPILQPSLSHLHTSYCLSHVKSNQSYNHLFLTFTLPTVYHMSRPTNLTTISFLPSHFLLFITCQDQPILQPSLSHLHTSYCLSHVKSNQSYNHLFLTFTLPTVYHMSSPTNLTTISFLPSHFLLFITCQVQPILQPSISYLHTSYCLSHVKTNQSYNHLFLTFTLPTVYHMSRPTNLTTISFLPSHFLLFITCQVQPILQPSLSYLHTSYCLSHVKTNQSYNHLFLNFTLPTVYHMSRPTNLTTISFLPSHFLLFITCLDQPILQPSLSYLHTSYCLSHVKSNQSYNHLFLTFTLPTVYHMSRPTNLTTISFLPSHFLLFITCQVQPILQPSLSYLHTSYCLSHV